jgi:excisionase family DNA binding protein
VEHGHIRAPEEEYLSTEQVANWINVPVSTVRYWRSLGRGPKAITFGRSVRYERRSVEQWIAEQARRAS